MDAFDSPVLVHFDDKEYIDYFSNYCDTFNYTGTGDKLHFKCKSYEEEYKLTIVKQNNQLFYYRPNSDTTILILKKAQSSNYIFDYLSNKQLIIDLPEGKGKIQTFGDGNVFSNPLYYAKSGNDLVVSFNDTTLIFDNNFYKFLINYKSNLSVIDLPFPIAIIADKNLKMEDMNRLKDQLRIVGFTKISYMLKLDGYEKVNYFAKRIPSLSEVEIAKFKARDFPFPPLLPSPPRLNDFILENGVLVEYSNNGFILENESIGLLELENRLMNMIIADSSSVLAYYIPDNSTYQDYIKFIDITTNLVLDMREKYLLDKYGIEYRELIDSDKQYVEARKKFPMRAWELDSVGYYKLRNAL